MFFRVFFFLWVWCGFAVPVGVVLVLCGIGFAFAFLVRTNKYTFSRISKLQRKNTSFFL